MYDGDAFGVDETCHRVGLVLLDLNRHLLGLRGPFIVFLLWAVVMVLFLAACLLLVLGRLRFLQLLAGVASRLLDHQVSLFVRLHLDETGGDILQHHHFLRLIDSL